MASTNLYPDPYLQWSHLTQFSGHAACQRHGAALLIPFLVRVSEAQRAALGKSFFVSPHHVRSTGPFMTVWAAIHDIGQLQDSVDSMMMALPIDRPPVAWAAQATGSPPPPRTQSLRPVIGVIDNDCAYLNTAFRNPDDPSKTRLLGLWRQDLPAAVGWPVPPEFGYGGELDGAAINEQIASNDEAASYRLAQYLMQQGGAFLQQSAHGTHVLDTLAGVVRAPAPALSAKPSRPDLAQQCDLVFVDVPRPKIGDVTGASSGAYLIDAVHYILAKADPDAPVLINISIGALAGPHDGSSLLELALDEILKETPRLLITVAAGNARGERLHARATLTPGSQLELGWRIAHGDPTDSFLELWGRCTHGGAPSQLDVELIAPDGLRCLGPLTSGQHACLPAIPNVPTEVCLAAFEAGGPKSVGQDMMILSTVAGLGPATQSNAGLWTLRLRNQSSEEQVMLDAWIQRDDPRQTTSGEPQSRLETSSDRGFSIFGDGALSDLATSAGVVVVGAACLRSDALATYSPGGSLTPDWRWRRGVDAYGASEEGTTFGGLYATGVCSDTLVPMAGTSVAAPVLARRLVNNMGATRFVNLGDRRAWLASMRSPITAEPLVVRP